MPCQRYQNCPFKYCFIVKQIHSIIDRAARWKCSCCTKPTNGLLEKTFLWSQCVESPSANTPTPPQKKKKCRAALMKFDTVALIQNPNRWCKQLSWPQTWWKYLDTTSSASSASTRFLQRSSRFDVDIKQLFRIPTTYQAVKKNI